MNTSQLALAALLALTGGCASAVAGPDAPPPPVEPDRQGLSDRLADGTIDLSAVPVDTEISVGAQLNLSDPEPSRQVLPLREGTLAIAPGPDGGITLSALTLDFDEIRIAPSRLDIELTDVQITLAAAQVGETTWVDEREAHVEMQVDLVLSWSLVRDDGSAWPLAPQRVEGIAVGLTARLGEDGKVTVELDGGTEDTLFRWSGLAELRGLDVALTATEGALR